MWLSIAVAALALGVSVLGGITLLRNTKSRINFTFALFAFSVAFWVVLNFIGSNFKGHDISFYTARLDFIVGGVLVYLLWEFSAGLLVKADSLISRNDLYSGYGRAIALVLVFVSSLSTFLSPVMHIRKPSDGNLQIVYGDYFLCFALPLVLVLLAALVNLFFVLRLAKGRLKQQVSLMLAAMAVSIIFAGFANLILPQLSRSQELNLFAGNLSYVGIAFFVFAASYSIIKHRLFDIRLVLARSVAYISLVVILIGAYSGISLLLSSLILGGYDPWGSHLLVPLISIIVLAFTISPLLKWLSKATSRLLYKDSYEPSQLIGEMNKVIVSNTELEHLLERSSDVMNRYLKPQFVRFEIQGLPSGTMSPKDGGREFSRSHFSKVIALSANDERVIVTEELSQGDGTLRGRLEDFDVAACVRLVAPTGNEQGCILLGSRKDGMPYTSQDISMLNIIAGELAVAVQNALHFKEIENFNKTLQQKVDSATRELKRKNERLRILDQTKDDFISMASHQLRTPLTSVKGYISMVLDGDAGKTNELQRKLLTQSFVSAQRMVYLISDLLNVSRLRTGKFVIEPMESNLARVIEEEVEQLSETAKSHGLTLVYNKPQNFPELMLDETKLRQVIMNFIDNAIYYTPHGGRIEVSLVEKPQSVEFTVVDNGIGVPKHEQHRLFTKFFRAHNAKNVRPDGTGLGIFMAKKVIVAQGGAIIFKSTEGKGSTFGFTFPKARLLPKPKPTDNPSAASKPATKISIKSDSDSRAKPTAKSA